MGGFGEFSRRMDDLASVVEPRAADIQRKAALAADQVLVLATPVDTGRARSNWITSIGAPVLEEREPYVQGSGGSTVGANSQAAIDQARSAVQTHRIGSKIFISNNVPYIGDLNDGSSAQAPAGFIERGIQAAVEEIDRQSGNLISVRRVP